MNNSGSDEQLRKELRALGAREIEIAALAGDPDRALAALAYAIAKGVEYPLPYTLKVYDSDWQPSGEIKRRVTNAHVEVSCTHCGGDRFVVVTDDWRELYAETYAPCAMCNADVNTTRWVHNERRVTVAR